MIRLIAAIDNKRGIAKSNRIPWDLPSDKIHFRELTLTKGANILMGRRTYDQMGSEYLSIRNNYIISHEGIKLKDNSKLVKDLDQFLSSFNKDLWVIGGEQIFALTINKAQELYLTLIEKDFNCDRFFPDYSGFKLKEEYGPYKESGLSFNYQLFTRF